MKLYNGGRNAGAGAKFGSMALAHSQAGCSREGYGLSCQEEEAGSGTEPMFRSCSVTFLRFFAESLIIFLSLNFPTCKNGAITVLSLPGLVRLT